MQLATSHIRLSCTGLIAPHMMIPLKNIRRLPGWNRKHVEFLLDWCKIFIGRMLLRRIFTSCLVVYCISNALRLTCFLLLCHSQGVLVQCEMYQDNTGWGNVREPHQGTRIFFKRLRLQCATFAFAAMKNPNVFRDLKQWSIYIMNYSLQSSLSSHFLPVARAFVLGIFFVVLTLLVSFLLSYIFSF